MARENSPYATDGGASPGRAVRLLAAPPLPALPTAQQLLGASSPRRPGELHEALPLSGTVARRLAREASRVGVSVDVAASVLLEAGLVTTDLGGHAKLDSSMSGPGTVALAGADAVYLRSLTLGRRRSSVSAQRVVAIPVRLVRRVAHNNVGDLLAVVPLEQALAWEVAALLAGRTMCEWALWRALSD